MEPTFARRVVLLLDHHDSRGGLGLVINRPSPVPLARIVPGLEGVEVREPLVRSGGPVERNRLFMLLRAASRPPGTERILEDTYGASTLAPLRGLIGSGAVSSAHFVVYAGYAGWAPGQLEAEIERGDWHVAPGRSEYVFDSDASEVWPRLIRYHGGQWVEGSRPQPGTRRRDGVAAGTGFIRIRGIRAVAGPLRACAGCGRGRVEEARTRKLRSRCRIVSGSKGLFCHVEDRVSDPARTLEPAES